MRQFLVVTLLGLGVLFSVPTCAQSLLEQQFKQRQEWLVSKGVIAPQTKPAHINELIAEDSPYLLKHALQQINWRSWSTQSLSHAADSHQLIYVSIGYETCHWCHEIAKQSYVDPTIAAVLNKHFVSIKVDREQKPNVDAMFKHALESVMENPGWPIQVVMTPSQKILWIDSYTPKATLHSRLSMLANKWQKYPQKLASLAEQQHGLMLPSSTPAKEVITKKQLHHRQAQILNEVRQILRHEQLGEGPRFLRANWLMQLLATNSDDDLNLVEQQVQQLLTSPTYDSIEGGMHRYAEDGLWLQPHFEKMLYDQGLLLNLLAALYVRTGEPYYRSFAEQVIGFVEARFFRNVGYGSSLSALDKSGSVSYYRVDSTNVLPPFAYSASAQLAHLTHVAMPPKKVNAALRANRDDNNTPELDEKIIFSWNAGYLASLINFYRATQDEAIKARLVARANMLRSTFFTPETFYRIHFQGRQSEMATLSDVAMAIVLYSELYWEFGNAEYYDVVRFSANLLVKRLNAVSWGYLIADSELPSDAALVVNAIDRLHYFMPQKELRPIREAIMPTLTSQALAINSFMLINNLVRPIAKQPRATKPFANGKGSIKAKRDSTQDSSVTISMAEGWHINAHIPSDDTLIPTQILPVQPHTLGAVNYPPGERIKVGVSAAPLNLYKGDIIIPFTAPKRKLGSIGVIVSTQACSDTFCLLPEEIQLTF
ncbi:DUF255 domain-containing protein [Alteromonas australica]|uniref:DUF255 domain-containing protein n=1 Tax=Alteromonas australica TaxID=589873 RepID=UPI00235203E5|nr:DUF255 domain-containing protein [Alteromonas australica]